VKNASLPPNQWPRKVVFRDPTPDGLINQRILMHAVMVLAKEAGFDKKENDGQGDGELFLRLVLLICRKMSSVWLHMDRFKKEQEELVKNFTGRPMSKPPILEMECSDTLFLEFDEFLVQIKSTLDYLVKLPRSVVGKSWNLTTFGDKGKTVVRAFQRNMPKQMQEKASKIEQHLFQKANLAWLDLTIRARDDMNHYLLGQITVEKFSVGRDTTGTVHVPMWSRDQALGDFMTSIWAYFFWFVEDFVTLIASLRFADGTELSLAERDAVSTKSPWKIVSKSEVDFMNAIQQGKIKFPGAAPNS